MAEEVILKVENLITNFNVSGKNITAVDDCSFQVNKGKTLGIVGESGCGKSVTSLSIMRLIPSPPGNISSGKIFFEKKNLLQLSEKEMRSIRGNRISMIFQEPMTSLNPVYTIGYQIAEVFILHKGASHKEARDLSIEMLKQVRIPSPEKRFNEYPHQLSGGMRQRIMIAIALACKPALLIADEPTTALDVTIQAQILALMNNLQKENGMSTILITHDLGVVAETCDDVVVMYAGKVVEKSSAKELFTNPKHPYTIGLLNSIPKLGEKKHRLNTIPGIVPSLANLPKGCRFQDRCSLASKECKETEPELKLINPNKYAACFKI
ncbi:ABC transporter ATP-binding protein [Fluviispira vulneris]|uniref:ABC transporter ATP-binding protein n=1 Tax=Fluviispira vulneris TaxID=2763012 RepID=UPI001645B44A|nr:ABC transporter ATP-binding protein [Fluviispira vulneris]